MMRQVYKPVAWHWKRMPTASLGGGAGITPVQNTYYTTLDTTRNARILSFAAKQTNDETAAKSIGVRVIIDGVTTSDTSANVPNNTWVYGYLVAYIDAYGMSTIQMMGKYMSLIGKSVKIDFRVTSAVGTNQLLFASVQYEELTKI